MVDLGEKNHCKCVQYDNNNSVCVNEFTISENGKTVKLTPETGENVEVIVIDGCIITADVPKCDALFLYHSRSKSYSILVELKGASDIPRAFEQLTKTKNSTEYIDIYGKFCEYSNRTVYEKCFIVSNGMISKPVHEKLEKENSIRITAILHSEPCRTVPDLRDRV